MSPNTPTDLERLRDEAFDHYRRNLVHMRECPMCSDLSHGFHAGWDARDARAEVERLKAQDLTHAVLAADIKLREERDALAAELETYKNQFKNEVDRATEFNNAERMRLAAQLAELRLAKPNAGSTDTLTEKYRLRRERDQLKAKLAEAKAELARLKALAEIKE